MNNSNANQNNQNDDTLDFMGIKNQIFSNNKIQPHRYEVQVVGLDAYTQSHYTFGKKADLARFILKKVFKNKAVEEFNVTSTIYSKIQTIEGYPMPKKDAVELSSTYMSFEQLDNYTWVRGM